WSGASTSGRRPGPATGGLRPAGAEGGVSRICGFLGEPYEQRMLRYFETPEARKGALLCRSWRNTCRSSQSNNHGKYRCELTKAEVLDPGRQIQWTRRAREERGIRLAKLGTPAAGSGGSRGSWASAPADLHCPRFPATLSRTCN